MSVFEAMESNVRTYCRAFPGVFGVAEDEFVYDETGRRYLDFLAGAGVLSYGHNNRVLRKALVDYLETRGISQGLDLQTVAKREFLEAFRRRILAPRGMDYVLQFTGPTGANAVEAALKIARKVKGRANVVAFTNAFHGVSLGALAVTGNLYQRGAAGHPLSGVTRMPYDGYLGAEIDTTTFLDKVLSDRSSGVDQPAAVIVETIQAEGGVNAASAAWLKRLAAVCERHDLLLIVDDIQTGCGRTGTFFSFEEAGVRPDVVILSKALSGYGLPLAVTMIRPDLDHWKPGEHNGTFRGNNLAFVTGRAALDHYWADARFAAETQRKGRYLHDRLVSLADKYGPGRFVVRGRGMLQGLDCRRGGLATRISRLAFRRGLIIETCGPDDQVLKCICPLTIQDDNLIRGLDIVEECLASALAEGSAPDPALG
jgi:diaminobutyrate-2-oxoglutarate transaminase